MKKFLGILVLSLLLSASCFAEHEANDKNIIQYLEELFWKKI